MVRFRNHMMIAGLLSVVSVVPAFAQQRSRPDQRSNRPARDRGASRTQLPEIGTTLPVVSAFDDQGIEFSTASLRGSYTVLVFGCLT